MMPDMLHRQPSEGASSTNNHGITSKKWRLPPIIRRRHSALPKDGKGWTSRHNEADSHDSLGPKSDASSTIIHESSESNYRQLREIVARLRSGPSGPKDVDAAYDLYAKYKERAGSLCLAILHEELGPTSRHRSPSHSGLDAALRRDSSLESPSGLYDQRSSFSGRSLTEAVAGTGNARGRHIAHNEAWLSVIREWRLHIDHLVEWFRTNLADTYRKFEQDATPEMVEALFNSRRFRKEAVHRMRNASVSRVISADPQFVRDYLIFPRYEIRFRNYEKAKEELIAVRSLVQSAESGISPDRKVTEIEVAPHGDAILEFANHHADMNPNDPVMRFRVSSQMLSETSPVFARIFSSSNLQSLYVYDDDDINVYLPPAPTRYTCRDGSEARVFRMPQLELNYLQSFEILLYAAHMKPEKVPKDITFEQFVAVAESCNRYKCTSPLERVVEDLWLPQWMRNGADDMADGMVVISYAFGLRTLFTRMSKSAILNLVDERDLQSKPWPQTIKSKLWAVRCAKMAQVYMCCTSAIQEYLPTPSRNPTDEIQPIAPSELRSNSRVPSSLPKPIASSPSALSTTPRCPKGSHACDAGNLGWIMLVFNELNVLSQVLRPTVLSHRPDAEREPSRSLAQIVEALRRIPSPLSPMHRGGVCDPSPAFRSAVNDIYNSVTGLTLHDVSGKSHGWALSRHFASEPDDLGSWGMERMAVNDRNHHSVATEFPENVRLKVLSYVDDLDDLHTAAMLNHLWYDTYITHERYLLRNIVRASYTRGAYAAGALHEPKLPKSISNAEEKVLKSESEQLRVERRGSVNMSESGDDEDDYESDAESDASSDNTPAPSISESIRRDIRLRPSASKKFTAAVAAAATTYSAASRPRPMPPPGSMGIILDSSGTTPRQSPPLSPSDASSLSESDQEKSSSTVSHTEYNDEPPMTEEEARHILWPNASDDDSARRAQASRQAQLGEGLREKFLADDKLLLEVLGDKRPEFTEDKRLLTEEQRATRADR